MRRCSVQGCTNPYKTRGYCNTHYLRMYTRGTTDAGNTTPGDALAYLFDTVLKHRGKNKCLIWPYARSEKGYAIIGYDGRTQHVHRVVCTKVYGKPPTKKHESCHACGKGKQGCVNQHHLYWGTPKQNGADRVRHGTARGPKGTANASAKLNDDKVRKILRMKGSSASIASKFGVSPSAIDFIRQGRTWKHIER